jgi:hypothetical protein
MRSKSVTRPARRVFVFPLILSLMSMLVAAAAPAAVGAAGGTTCTGGAIDPGSYHSLTITGDCVATGGAIIVAAGLVVAPGASLTATTSAATVSVSGGIWVGEDGVLLFGCSPSLTNLCGPDTSYTVSGGIRADRALAVILHGNTITGGVTIAGGGGDLSCSGVLFGGFVPAFTTLENNRISGGVKVSGLTSCWFGMARNTINGAVTLTGNTFGDPDAMEILDNTIHGQLACSGNLPVATNIADGVALEPNTVAGKGSGECAGL